MVLIAMRPTLFKSMMISLIMIMACMANIANADIYLDFSNSLISTSNLLGASAEQSKERYIILNGVPITTKIYQINSKHNVAIEKVSNELDKANYQTDVSSDNLELSMSEPTVIVTKDWSAIYRINLEQIREGKAKKELPRGNYIALAKKVSLNQSMIFELEFNDANEMKDLIFETSEDVNCGEVLEIKRYPNSRRKFCLTEIVNDKISSQTVIFEGGGNSNTRIDHYQSELVNMDYQMDVIDKSSSDKSILFASNEFSNTTVFTYKSNNKVLDIIQSHF